MCGRPIRPFPQWIWSQFTLAYHAFVWLSNALYLIFKFAVAHRQSFDDDIRALPHTQACRKQTSTNLEFVHDAHQTVSLYARNWGKSTQKEWPQATSWLAEFPHTKYFYLQIPNALLFPIRVLERAIPRIFSQNLRRATRAAPRQDFGPRGGLLSEL